MSTLSDPHSLHPSIFLPSYDIFNIPCLLDSGSTHCFIDSSFIKKHKIPTYSIPPILLHLFNGSSSSSISFAVDHSLAFTSGETTSETFFITSLDSSCMIILGHCWLTHYCHIHPNPYLPPPVFSIIISGIPSFTSRPLPRSCVFSASDLCT